MKKFLMAAMVLGVAASASADYVGGQSIQCSAFPRAIRVDLERSRDGGMIFGGTGIHNYDNVRYPRCKETSNQVICSGAWVFRNDSARLVVTLQKSGIVSAVLQGPGDQGLIKLSCVVH